MKFAFRILLTAGLLVLLFRQVNWYTVWDVVKTLDGGLLAATCLMWLPTQYLQYLKWDLLAREAGENISRADIRRGYWVGFTLGLITPGRIGQIGRALALHNCSLPKAFGLSAVERGYTAIIINAMGLLSLVMLPLLGWIPPLPIANVFLQIAFAATGLFLILLGLFPRMMLRPLHAVVRWLPYREKLEQAVNVIENTGPRRGSILLSLSAASMFTSLFQFVLFIRAAGADIPVFSGMLAALLTFFLKGAIPISVGSLGVGEWAAVFCLGGLGVMPSVAVASSLLLFTLNVFIPSLIGLPFIGTLRIPHLSKSHPMNP